ncbi:threonine--tRNA ligase, partial [Candidatus Wolfebacteria bacterium]|nr:threonine--tRNA ligase [Candidatus Wolfebacteria bacterium]
MKEDKSDILRHSTAHILAAAVLEIFPKAKFGIGPTIENGFYYDFDFVEADKRGYQRGLNADKKISVNQRTHQRKSAIAEGDLVEIEKRMRNLIKKDLKFKKEIISYAEAKKLFKDQPYKLELIKELLKTKSPITIYTSGEFVDLCKGPHVVSAKEINPDAFKLTRIAGAYWKGSEKNPMLTRIYGVAFANKKELDEHLKIQEEVEKRDHRKLGEKLDLFSFHNVAPAAVFWHPKGMIILNELQKYIRELQQKRGYLETLTPILVKKELYEASGHWKHYQENIFPLKINKEIFALKPMNCPESAYIYSSKIRSYKDLPLRLSEFGNLYRKEKSGTLTGLFRVYGFIQDDAHIYCQPDQIFEEINGVLELITTIHKTFNLKTLFAFATKPDKAMGDPKLWVKAEKALQFALTKNKLKYELRPKDGAFYGPKIDIDVEDALSRKWTVSTIQLDFQIPERLNLEYIDQKGKRQRPVIIHRSSIGSFERF